MTEHTLALPKVVGREEWITVRTALLTREKELTRARDALNAERRRLPMVEIEKDYIFEGPAGPASLLSLFDGRRQLIVYHFMFDPTWDEGCRICSFVIDNIGHRTHLHARDTTLALVSRAPITKIGPFKARMGWSVPWFSSNGSDFNYDFHVTLDEDIAPAEYNYRDATGYKGEGHGVSVFLRHGDRVFHTYSSYARGGEVLIGTYHYLDLTPLGRQEKWEHSPEGWPQTTTLGWLHHHDNYDA